MLNGSNPEQISFIHLPTYQNGKKRNSRISLSQQAPGLKWQENLYRLPDLLARVKDLQAQNLRQNLFFSLNAFGRSRRFEHLTELLTLYADLDCYKMDISPDYARYLVLELASEGKIPHPNIIAYSGRGIWVLWPINPTPRKAFPLWAALQAHFGNLLAHVGADKKARDASRIIRTPGSLHLGSDTVVKWEILHEDRFPLDWFRDEYLPDLIKTPTKQAKPRQALSVHRKFMTLFSLHMLMIEDLQRLADLRGRKLKGHREFFLFIWRNCLVRLGYSAESSEREIKGVALDYLGSEALPDREWTQTTMSAHRAKHQNKNGEDEAGYKLSAKWIIDKLEITPEEQKTMAVLIGRQEKYRRSNEKRRPKRAKQNRAEYLAELEEKRRLVLQLRQEHPNASYIELARLSGVSLNTVKRTFRLNNL